MKSRFATALPLGLIALAPAGASGQAGPKAVSSATAVAEIVARDLNLTEGIQLTFGLVKSNKSSVPGTVVVKPEGIRSPFDGAEIVGSGPCQTEWCEDETSPSNPDSASYWGPGVFTVSGSPNSTYRVVAGADTATAYWRTPATGREPALQVTDFTFATKSSGYSSNVGTLDADGNDTIRVGGTLQVVAGMKTASYRVHVPVTIQYN
jgi:hypothetical protein